MFSRSSTKINNIIARVAVNSRVTRPNAIFRHNGLRSRGPCYSTGTTSDTTKTTLNAQRNNIILGVSALLALSGLISYRRGKRLQHDAKSVLSAPPTDQPSASEMASMKPTVEADFPPLPARLTDTNNAHPTMRDRMQRFVMELQRQIVTELSALDGTPFHVEAWKRDEGGEGISCVLQGGRVFEKAGVNISIVHGQLPEAAVRQMRAEHKELDPSNAPYPFFAAGISLVLHPHNPKAPTVHANYRYFEVEQDESKPPVWWFGGGCDLTPSYLYVEDAKYFHQTLKDVCERHRKGSYREYKLWCDDYFNVKHRGERRGVGGIFFDDLNTCTPEEGFAFVQDAGRSFLRSYLPILKRRMDEPYTIEEKQWQQLRRGRYVEFNLVHDRGTKFGLATPGPRIESILMSLPLTARWQYQHLPTPGSSEAQLLAVLREPKDWIPLD